MVGKNKTTVSSGDCFRQLMLRTHVELSGLLVIFNILIRVELHPYQGCICICQNSVKVWLRCVHFIAHKFYLRRKNVNDWTQLMMCMLKYLGGKVCQWQHCALKCIKNRWNNEERGTNRRINMRYSKYTKILITKSRCGYMRIHCKLLSALKFFIKMLEPKKEGKWHKTNSQVLSDFYFNRVTTRLVRQRKTIDSIHLEPNKCGCLFIFWSKQKTKKQTYCTDNNGNSYCIQYSLLNTLLLFYMY